MAAVHLELHLRELLSGGLVDREVDRRHRARDLARDAHVVAGDEAVGVGKTRRHRVAHRAAEAEEAEPGHGTGEHGDEEEPSRRAERGGNPAGYVHDFGHDALS